MHLKSSLAVVVLCSLLLCSCATIRPRGAAGATSQPVCLTRAEYQKVRLALYHLKDRIADCKRDCRYARERDANGYRTALKGKELAIFQCRQERDKALSRKCPVCKSCAKWPVVVGVISGVVVGAGVGIVVGFVLR